MKIELEIVTEEELRMENRHENEVADGCVEELKRPSMRCMVCGLTAYARDTEMAKYGKSHYDCQSGGHSFYPRAIQQH